jgi:hypothetical protein
MRCCWPPLRPFSSITARSELCQERKLPAGCWTAIIADTPHSCHVKATYFVVLRPDPPPLIGCVRALTHFPLPSLSGKCFDPSYPAISLDLPPSFAILHLLHSLRPARHLFNRTSESLPELFLQHPSICLRCEYNVLSTRA